jgi:hypothetical protein
LISFGKFIAAQYIAMKHQKRLLVALWALGLASGVQANTITFSPADLSTFSGACYYTWGINWTLPAGEFINSATLSFGNVTMPVSPSSRISSATIWSHLLDTSTGSGTTQVTSGLDGSGGTDHFAGQGLVLGRETFAVANSARNFSYNLDLAMLTAYVADGHFAIGIDPNWNYTARSIVLTINYSSTRNPPQPVHGIPDGGSTGMLLGLALLVLRSFRRVK